MLLRCHEPDHVILTVGPTGSVQASRLSRPAWCRMRVVMSLLAPELLAQLSRWREQGLTVVLTNGCFDILHSGHLCLLEAARLSGDRLVVALNGDRSVRGLKGEGRP